MVIVDPVSNHGRDGQEIRQDTPPREAARKNNPNPGNKISDVHKDSRSNPANTRHAGNTKRNKNAKESVKSEAERSKDTSTEKDNPAETKDSNSKVENRKNDKVGVFINKLV